MSGAGPVAPAPPVPLRVLARRFWPFARPYRRRLLLALALVVLQPAAEAGTIYTYKLLVDRVIVPRDLGALPAVGGLYAALTLLTGTLAFSGTYLGSWVSEHVLLDLRVDVFRHLQTLSLDFFERHRLGDLLSRLVGDVSAIETMMLDALSDALLYFSRIAFFTAAIFILNVELAAATLVVLPLFWIASRHFSREIKQASREWRRRSGTTTAVAEESLGNAAIVQAYNQQRGEVARLAREGWGVLVARLASIRLSAMFSPLTDVFEMIGGLLVVALGTYEIARGNLSLGGLVAFLGYLSQLYSPIGGLGRIVNTFFAATAGAERVNELLDQHPTVTDPPAPRALGRARGHLVFDDVSFRYPGIDRDALEHASFEVRPGETVALVGVSGAGKSTVTKLALRFYDPTGGAVRLDGVDLRELALHDLREQVALLLQETLIFEGTVRENIAFGRPGAGDDEIAAAARAADADGFVEALPEGYDTVVGQRGRRLSGGQRQRLAIARAMIRDAPVLVLDEPTTGLDVESARRILAPLRRLMSGRATVLISHDLLATAEADSIIVLEEGRVVEQGDHASLLAHRGVYARLWQAHAREDEHAKRRLVHLVAD